MKNLKISKLIICLIFVTILFFGCNNKNDIGLQLITDGVEYVVSENRQPLEYYSFYIPKFGAEVMPVGGYLEPLPPFEIKGQRTPDYGQDRLDAIAQAGINLIIGTHTNYAGEGEATRLLELTGNAGIVTTIRANSLINIFANHVATAEQMALELKTLMRYPGFAGLYCLDEPKANLFSAISRANETFKQALEIINEDTEFLQELGISSAEAMLYLNLGGGPNAGDYSGTGDLTYTYEEFVDDFLDTKPQYLMFDRYPLVAREGAVSELWFVNISIIRSKAEQAALPWWGFTQATGHYNGITNLCRIPTEGEFLWGMNSMLAYGAKGIGHFHLTFPPEWTAQEDYSTTGMFDPFGKKNKFYYFVQKGNEHLAAIDHYLMQSKHVGVIQHGDTPAPIPQGDLLGTSWRELQSVTGDDAIIGCFDYKGKTALYVLNNKLGKDGAKVTLNFDNKYGYDVIQRAQSVAVTGTSIPLTLKAGEGVLITLR